MDRENGAAAGDVTEPAGPLQGSARARSELGHRGTRRRPASGRARCRRHQGRAAGWGSFSTPARLPRVESQPEVGGPRPQGGRGPRRVPTRSATRPTCWWRRSAPARWTGSGSPTQTSSAQFPRVVFCSVPAYPPGHRFADRPGWDATVQARSGMQSEQPAWRPGPVYLHFPAPSMAACFLLAAGVLSALIRREATGRGQHVADLALSRRPRLHHADLAGARTGARRVSRPSWRRRIRRASIRPRSSSVPTESGSTPRR